MSEEARAAYDTVAEAYAAQFPDTAHEQAVDLAMIEHAVSLVSPDSRDVLDAGCGTGRMARYLTDRGCRVRGVDLSPAMIAMARRDHPDLDVQVASIAALPFPDAEFDLALYWYSTIHVPDAEMPGVLSEARRVLRDDGVVVVGFQVGRAPTDVGALYRRLGHDVTLTRFDRTPDQVSQLLADAGFSEQARLVRRPVGERSDQAVLVARADG